MNLLIKCFQSSVEVKAVIFDMDGVITNTMPDHYKAWKTILKREGINAGYHDIYSREGQRGIDSVKEIFKSHNKTVSDREASRILKDKEKYFNGIVKTRFIPGARNFLKELRESSSRLALVTGTARHEVRKILPDNLYHLFSVIITGSDVQNGKPHPEPYLKALKELRLRAREAVVVENAPFGIASAKKAGLRCLALETSLAKIYLREADAVFSSFKELRNKIKFSDSHAI